ncbi:hypothetical protein BJX70DRAFT_403366 [Aspergillus crustosus]
MDSVMARMLESALEMRKKSKLVIRGLTAAHGAPGTIVMTNLIQNRWTFWWTKIMGKKVSDCPTIEDVFLSIPSQPGGQDKTQHQGQRSN